MRMSVGWAAWLAALAGFIVFAALASQHEYFSGDPWLTDRLQDIDSAAFRATLDYTEDLSDWPWLVAVYLAGAGALLLTLGWQQALLVGAALAGRLANSGLKELIGRPRPSLSLVEADGQPSSLSFPSGHAEGTILLWGMLFYFATVYLKDARLRLPAQALSLWVIVGTGLERVHVGHHWPSDVLGGFWAGGLILAMLIAVEQLVRRRRAVVAYS
jgi:undecaprenyl-diphosphatase